MSRVPWHNYVSFALTWLVSASASAQVSESLSLMSPSANALVAVDGEALRRSPLIAKEGDAAQLQAEIETLTADIRKAMTQKYRVEF
jgi:hypothetical protein